MGSAVLEGVRSANIYEFCFQAAKRSDMDCVELQWGPFVHCQAWHIQVSKLSDNCSNIPQENGFVDVYCAKRSDMSSTILQEVRFADAQE